MRKNIDLYLVDISGNPIFLKIYPVYRIVLFQMSGQCFSIKRLF